MNGKPRLEMPSRRRWRLIETDRRQRSGKSRLDEPAQADALVPRALLKEDSWFIHNPVTVTDQVALNPSKSTGAGFGDLDQARAPTNGAGSW